MSFNRASGPPPATSIHPVQSLTSSSSFQLTTLAFLICISTQVYGTVSHPSLVDIHNRNPSFFSPAPIAIAIIFPLQQIAQAVWLWKFWTLRAAAVDGSNDDAENEADDGFGGGDDVMRKFAPFFILGNILLAAWVPAWLTSSLTLSFLLIFINFGLQLTFAFGFLPAPSFSTYRTNTPAFITQVVSKTMLGIALLDSLHTGAVAFAGSMQPSLAVKVFAALVFVGLAVLGDAIVGAWSVVDLVALSSGQGAAWGQVLGWYAVGVAGVVVTKTFLRTRWATTGRGGYQSVSGNVENAE